MATATHAFHLCDFTFELTDDAFKILLIPHLDVICAPDFYLLPGCSQHCCFCDVVGTSLRMTDLELLQGHVQVLQKANVC